MPIVYSWKLKGKKIIAFNNEVKLLLLFYFFTFISVKNRSKTSVLRVDFIPCQRMYIGLSKSDTIVSISRISETFLFFYILF